jgi:hypothetical protein
MRREQFLIDNHHCCDSVKSSPDTTGVRDTHNAHDGDCKYIGENHEKNCNNGHNTQRIRKMFVLQAVSLTLVFPKCCLPWYIIRSFGFLRNIFLPDFQNNVRTAHFAHHDLPGLTQIGYRNVIQDYQICKKSLFRNNYLLRHNLKQNMLAALKSCNSTTKRTKS